jgi:DNA excision repair protein ERCC-2
VAVIGVGRPQVNAERNLIRQYFDTQGYDGFHHTYTRPGMNCVLQAAGRMIRTEHDHSAWLLIDDRFATDLSQSLLPSQWESIRTAGEPSALSEIMARFWDDEGSRST